MDVAQLVEQVLSSPASAREVPVPALARVVDLPPRYLDLAGGHCLTGVAQWTDNYYGDFFAFVSGAPGGRERYLEHLRRIASTDGPELDALILRGARVWLSREYGMTYDGVDGLLGLLQPEALPLSVDDCIDLVMDNYLSMARASTAHTVYGSLSACGRGSVLEGSHRALINLSAGFPTTPFGVLDRHPEWMQLLRFFRDQGRDLYGDDTAMYHAVDHPDFDGCHVLREDRSQPIIDHLHRLDVRRALDLGSMIGFYSHRLAADGIEVTAVEFEVDYAHALQQLSGLYGLSDLVQLRHEDVFARSYLAPGETYDAVLILSLLYHLLRRDTESCISWLREIQAAFDIFIVDTEPRTGVLPRERLEHLFSGFRGTTIFRGADDREIVCFVRE